MYPHCYPCPGGAEGAARGRAEPAAGAAQHRHPPQGPRAGGRGRGPRQAAQDGQQDGDRDAGQVRVLCYCAVLYCTVLYCTVLCLLPAPRRRRTRARRGRPTTCPEPWDSFRQTNSYIQYSMLWPGQTPLIINRADRNSSSDRTQLFIFLSRKVSAFN